MQSNIIVLLLIVHVLGDFYLQSEKLAKAKRICFSALLKHIALFIIPVAIISILFWSKAIILCLIIMTITHFIIDCFKFIFEKNTYSDSTRVKEFEKSSKSSYLYAIDQLIHLLVIIILSYFFSKSGESLKVLSILEFNIDKVFIILKFFLMYSLVLKPVNISFSKLYAHLKPTDSLESETSCQSRNSELNTGSMIGNLERLLVLTLLMCNQYSAIGLIFAAKSITRFSKISESQSFAEYYLLGTLFSILSTVLIYLGVNILVT